MLIDLAEKIRRKYEEGIKTGKYPKASEVIDPALVDEDNIVTATPIDRVYEHGFFPLEGQLPGQRGRELRDLRPVDRRSCPPTRSCRSR